ncbi:MAG TPA: ABC transporter ATP-binding protein [Actinomycetaceae bacterium]|nr:ABC transporter ATP-binding protein [Actinomycetaceae bacterium]
MTFTVIDGEFQYPHAHNPILQDINFSVDEGELLAILGPNGAGKTTLVRTIIGLLKWSRGRTELDGVDLAELSPQEIGRTISYVPQARSAVSLSLTGLDMVTIGRAPHLGLFAQPGREERDMAWETLTAIGAERLARMPCGNMSGGQFQMILIARALIAEPRILVLDEPETGLDFHNQLVVLKLLRRLVDESGLTVIMNTHYPAHALRIADKVLLVDSAHTPTYGSVADVMTEGGLEDTFDVEVRISEIDHRCRRIPTVTAMDIRQAGTIREQGMPITPQTAVRQPTR